MSEGLERAARALGEVLYGYVDPVGTPNTWGMAEAAVRAVLEALRDPPAEVLSVSAYSLMCGEGDKEEGLRDLWRDQIDALLGGGRG